MRCWQCGVEPLKVVETTSLGAPQQSFVPGRWPDGDHEHAIDPPSPHHLAEEGHRALRRIQEAP